MIMTNSNLHTLQPGDVVRITSTNWAGAHMEGPLVERSDGALTVGTVGYITGAGYVVRHADGRPSNHDRTVILVRRSGRSPRTLRL